MSIEIIFLFLIIAILYSSIGFGGGSSYLAILSLYEFDQTEMKLIALLCNITVVLGASVLYYKQGLIKFRKVIPLVLLSIPLAFIGGKIVLAQELFLLILGVTLVGAGILILVKMEKKVDLSEDSINSSSSKNAGIGGFVGFISGLVGIGGGIFLSPILYLQKWDTPKVIAATSSFFILVNSIAGVLGNLSNGIPSLNWILLVYLLVAVFIGGQIGTRLSIFAFKGVWIKNATGILIMFIGFRLVLKLI